MQHSLRLTLLLILGIFEQSISAQGITLAYNQPTTITLQIDTSGGTCILTWSTVREVNIRYFIAEKSNDGFAFHTLATVLPTNNYSLPAHYKLGDEEISAIDDSDIYYRVCTVDMNGSRLYSEPSVVTPQRKVHPIVISGNDILSEK